MDHPGQNTLGHHFDPGQGRHFGLAAHPVADGLARGLAQGLCHPFRCGAHSKATRFQHDNPALDQPRLQQGQWHPRGFARTGRGLQHGPPMDAQGLQ